MSKTRRGFDLSLTIVSLVGFLFIAINAFTGVTMSSWLAAVFMLIAGIGLMLEGNILTVNKWGKDGIQGPEVPFILSMVFGGFTFIIGILAMPFINIVTTQTQTITGIVAILSIIFITVQKWILD